MAEAGQTIGIQVGELLIGHQESLHDSQRLPIYAGVSIVGRHVLGVTLQERLVTAQGQKWKPKGLAVQHVLAVQDSTVPLAHALIECAVRDNGRVLVSITDLNSGQKTVVNLEDGTDLPLDPLAKHVLLLASSQGQSLHVKFGELPCVVSMNSIPAAVAVHNAETAQNLDMATQSNAGVGPAAPAPATFASSVILQGRQSSTNALPTTAARSNRHAGKLVGNVALLHHSALPFQGSVAGAGNSAFAPGHAFQRRQPVASPTSSFRRQQAALAALEADVDMDSVHGSDDDAPEPTGQGQQQPRLLTTHMPVQAMGAADDQPTPGAQDLVLNRAAVVQTAGPVQRNVSGVPIENERQHLGTVYDLNATAASSQIHTRNQQMHRDASREAHLLDQIKQQHLLQHRVCASVRHVPVIPQQTPSCLLTPTQSQELGQQTGGHQPQSPQQKQESNQAGVADEVQGNKNAATAAMMYATPSCLRTPTDSECDATPPPSPSPSPTKIQREINDKNANAGNADAGTRHTQDAQIASLSTLGLSNLRRTPVGEDETGRRPSISPNPDMTTEQHMDHIHNAEITNKDELTHQHSKPTDMQGGDAQAVPAGQEGNNNSNGPGLHSGLGITLRSIMGGPFPPRTTSPPPLPGGNNPITPFAGNKMPGAMNTPFGAQGPAALGGMLRNKSSGSASKSLSFARLTKTRGPSGDEVSTPSAPLLAHAYGVLDSIHKNSSHEDDIKRVGSGSEAHVSARRSLQASLDESQDKPEQGANTGANPDAVQIATAVANGQTELAQLVTIQHTEQPLTESQELPGSGNKVASQSQPGREGQGELPSVERASETHPDDAGIPTSVHPGSEKGPVVSDTNMENKTAPPVEASDGPGWQTRGKRRGGISQLPWPQPAEADTLQAKVAQEDDKPADASAEVTTIDDIATKPPTKHATDEAQSVSNEPASDASHALNNKNNVVDHPAGSADIVNAAALAVQSIFASPDMSRSPSPSRETPLKSKVEQQVAGFAASLPTLQPQTDPEGKPTSLPSAPDEQRRGQLHDATVAVVTSGPGAKDANAAGDDDARSKNTAARQELGKVSNMSSMPTLSPGASRWLAAAKCKPADPRNTALLGDVGSLDQPSLDSFTQSITGSQFMRAGLLIEQLLGGKGSSADPGKQVAPEAPTVHEQGQQQVESTHDGLQRMQQQSEGRSADAPQQTQRPYELQPTLLNVESEPPLPAPPATHEKEQQDGDEAMAVGVEDEKHVTATKSDAQHASETGMQAAAAAAGNSGHAGPAKNEVLEEARQEGALPDVDEEEQQSPTSTPPGFMTQAAASALEGLAVGSPFAFPHSEGQDAALGLVLMHEEQTIEPDIHQHTEQQANTIKRGRGRGRGRGRASGTTSKGSKNKSGNTRAVQTGRVAKRGRGAGRGARSTTPSPEVTDEISEELMELVKEQLQPLVPVIAAAQAKAQEEELQKRASLQQIQDQKSLIVLDPAADDATNQQAEGGQHQGTAQNLQSKDSNGSDVQEADAGRLSDVALLPASRKPRTQRKVKSTARGKMPLPFSPIGKTMQQSPADDNPGAAQLEEHHANDPVEKQGVHNHDESNSIEQRLATELQGPQQQQQQPESTGMQLKNDGFKQKDAMFETAEAKQNENVQDTALQPPQPDKPTEQRIDTYTHASNVLHPVNNVTSLEDQEVTAKQAGLDDAALHQVDTMQEVGPQYAGKKAVEGVAEGRSSVQVAPSSNVVATGDLASRNSNAAEQPHQAHDTQPSTTWQTKSVARRGLHLPAQTQPVDQLETAEPATTDRNDADLHEQHREDTTAIPRAKRQCIEASAPTAVDITNAADQAVAGAMPLRPIVQEDALKAVPVHDGLAETAAGHDIMKTPEIKQEQTTESERDDGIRRNTGARGRRASKGNITKRRSNDGTATDTQDGSVPQPATTTRKARRQSHAVVVKAEPKDADVGNPEEHPETNDNTELAASTVDNACVQFSSQIDKKELTGLKAIVRRLKGTCIATDTGSSITGTSSTVKETIPTHLILPPSQFTRSPKQLMAIARGTQVVSAQWLHDCDQAGKWIAVMRKHMGADAKSQSSWDFNLWDALQRRARNGPLLQGCRVMLTAGLASQEGTKIEALQQLVTAAGGTVMALNARGSGSAARSAVYSQKDRVNVGRKRTRASISFSGAEQLELDETQDGVAPSLLVFGVAKDADAAGLPAGHEVWDKETLLKSLLRQERLWEQASCKPLFKVRGEMKTEY